MRGRENAKDLRNAIIADYAPYRGATISSPAGAILPGASNPFPAEANSRGRHSTLPATASSIDTDIEEINTAAATGEVYKYFQKQASRREVVYLKYIKNRLNPKLELRTLDSRDRLELWLWHITNKGKDKGHLTNDEGQNEYTTQEKYYRLWHILS